MVFRPVKVVHSGVVESMTSAHLELAVVGFEGCGFIVLPSALVGKNLSNKMSIHQYVQLRWMNVESFTCGKVTFGTGLSFTAWPMFNRHASALHKRF